MIGTKRAFSSSHVHRTVMGRKKIESDDDDDDGDDEVDFAQGGTVSLALFPHAADIIAE